MSGFAEITYCQELFQCTVILEKVLAELKAECNALKALEQGYKVWFSTALALTEDLKIG